MVIQRTRPSVPLEIKREEVKPVEIKPEEKKEEKKPVEEVKEESEVEKAKNTLEKMEKVSEKLDEQIKTLDKKTAEALLTGKGVIQGVKEIETDVQYLEAMERGDVDPLKDDKIY